MIFAKDLPIDDKYPESCVYWIYHEDLHNNPRKSGYVGVCVSGCEKRFKEHLYQAEIGSKLRVHKAIRKYGSKIRIKTLVKADPEFCLLVEEMLRPVPRMIGTWNICVGGIKTTLGLTHSEELKVKLSKERKGNGNPFFGRTHSTEWKSEMSLKRTGRKIGPHLSRKPWTSAQASASSLEFWKNAQHYFDCWLLYGKPKFSNFTRKVGAFDVPNKPLRTMLDKFINGWQPCLDDSYLEWLSEYNKQKETENVT